MDAKIMLPMAGPAYPAEYAVLRGDLPEALDPAWPGFAYGIFVWSVRTLFELQAAGLKCELAEELPSSGLVLGHPDTLPRRIERTRGREVVCLKADRATTPGVNGVLVQSPLPLRATARLRVRGIRSAYVPHWPALGLLPRHPNRGRKLERLAYFGRQENLHPELCDPSWQAWCASEGFCWELRDDPSRWHDYRDVDAIIAIRPDEKPKTAKPPSKLLNAYLAGVMPFLGPEPAYRAEGRPGRDYLEVTSVDALKCELIKRRRAGQNLARDNRRRAEPAFLRQRWVRALQSVVRI